MKIGIFICDRYKSCAGGKCFRAMKNREGAFDIFLKEENLEIAGSLPEAVVLGEMPNMSLRK